MNNVTPQLNTALAQAKAKFPIIYESKNVDFTTKTGSKIKFTYAELEDIVNLLSPVLSEYGLCISHVSEYHETTPGIFVYGLVTSLLHESGECRSSFIHLPEGMGSDPKEFKSRISYARRYNTESLLDIVAVSPSSKEEWESKSRQLREEVKAGVRTDLNLSGKKLGEPKPVSTMNAPKSQVNPPYFETVPITANEPAPAKAKEIVKNPGNVRIVAELRSQLRFPQERLDAYMAKAFPGIPLEEFTTEGMDKMIIAIASTYAKETGTTEDQIGRAVQDIRGRIINPVSSGLGIETALANWIIYHF